MEHIPGSYPADTPQATPQATLQQEPNMWAQSASSQPHGIFSRHEHPERSKLHKPEDPRSHQQTDSGVGFGAMSSDPIQPSTAQEPRKLPHLEAIGGGTYATEDPLPSINSVPQRSYSPPTQLDTTYTYANSDEQGLVDERSHSHSNMASGIDAMGSSQDTAMSGQMHDQRHDQAHDQSAPYWGSLPKAASGGIYNTVMGHGSSKDDHEQHHNLPERSAAAETARIPGHTADYPRGTGIYNTVAGHGSQDEESPRHSSHASAGVAPLPETKEERPAEFAEPRTGRSDPAHGGFLLGTHVPDSLLSGGSARNTDVNTAGTIGETAKPSAVETGPRAFPLVSGHEKIESHRDGVTDNADRRQPESNTKHHALLAAAGGAAAATAVSQKEKPGKLKKRQGSPDEDLRGRSEDDRGVDAAAIGGNLPYRPNTEEHKSRSKSRSKSKSKSDESSPARKHTILGIFHRRKGSKDEAEEHKKEGTEHHSHHKKEAAAAATGAGTYGFMHHHKDKDTTKTSTEEPITQPKHHHSIKPAGAAATTQALPHSPTHMGAAGAAIPRVPTKSEKRRSISPRTSAAMANQAEAGDEAPFTQPGPTDNTHRRSEGGAMKYAGAGAAAGVGAGLGASLFARDHRGSEPTTGGPVFEHPREPPSAPFNPSQAAGAETSSPSPRAAPMRQSEDATVKPGDYNTPPSGTASGVKTAATAGALAAAGHTASGSHVDSGKYNTLPSSTAPGVKTGTGSRDMPSGTASGVKSDIISSLKRHSAGNGTSTSSAAPESSEEEYNVLPSGTPSGVKVKPRSQRTSNAGSSEDHHTARNALFASGAAAGLAGAHRHREKSQPDNTQSTNYALPPQPMATRDTSLGDESPKVFQSQTSQSQYPSSSQMAQGMSPAVLPDSYRAQSHATPAGDVPRPSREPPMDSSSSSNYSREPVSRAPAVDPALAAATGAWTASGGRSSGAPQKPMVVHKCEHCGHDNDVSSVFTKENIEKMSHSHGSGNWFQNAWSHA